MDDEFVVREQVSLRRIESVREHTDERLDPFTKTDAANGKRSATANPRLIVRQQLHEIGDRRRRRRRGWNNNGRVSSSRRRDGRPGDPAAWTDGRPLTSLRR